MCWGSILSDLISIARLSKIDRATCYFRVGYRAISCYFDVSRFRKKMGEMRVGDPYVGIPALAEQVVLIYWHMFPS